MPRITPQELVYLIEDTEEDVPENPVADGAGDELWEEAKDALTYDFPDIELLKQCGNWAVTDVGLVCLTMQSGHYFIRKEALSMSDWPQHMTEKYWCEIPEFLLAFYTARRILKIKPLG